MNTAHQLVRPLALGPVDVIGDIHGEREALANLLAKLGYDAEGHHASSRCLVFVGDFCDRGPDSLGVMRLVEWLVESGRAQAVAGNHELNLLRGSQKHGNHWFYGATHDPQEPVFGECAAISEEEREPMLAFLRTLPVALENEHLRIVHAAWIDSSIEQCRRVNKPLDAAYNEFDAQKRASPQFLSLKAARDVAKARLKSAPGAEATPAEAEALGRYDEYIQMGNPSASSPRASSG